MPSSTPPFSRTDWNSTESEYPRTQTLCALIESQADRTPDRPAAVMGAESLSYADLVRRANRVAAALAAHGTGPGSFVGIHLERGFDLLAAQLGVLKAGGAFACFDPRYPAEALERLVETANLPVVLTRSALAGGFPIGNGKLLRVDDLPRGVELTQIHPASPADPACLLFTSGSTGQPKAVLHTHRNLISRFWNTLAVGALGLESVFAQCSPVSSIDALDELFLPLLCGGRTAIIPYETVIDPHALVDELARQAATHILLVPSLLRVILAAGAAQKLARLRTWMVGGEALHGALAEQFYEQFPQATLINYYGLTEGDAACHVVQRGYDYPGSVPIGRPVRNTKIYLLEEDLSTVAPGQPGEIALASEGLFREYLGRDDLNVQRWKPNPFEADAGGPYGRIFLTGDLGRIDAGGELEYLGRRDRMAKIRGFRVELGEVEAALLRHPAVEACAAAARSVDGQARLAAYVVPRAGADITSAALLAFARETLPDFAVPSAMALLEALPLTPNGKIDLAALPYPAGVVGAADEDFEAPRSPLEAQLASIWEGLLGRRGIGIHDNFFEIGGDSLAAIDMVLRIEKATRKPLPISALMQTPTIAGLAALLGSKQQERWSSLVPIRPEGDRLPLFCIHADGGVLFYYNFARLMKSGIPLYGLQARGVADRRDPPLTRIEDMAAHYIRELQTIQPHGPYRLCAFSAGGVIIFEMARQLLAAGEPVAMVAMLDAYGPGYPQLLPGKSLAEYKLSVHRNTLRLHGFWGKLGYLYRRAYKRSGMILSDLTGNLFLALRMPLPHKIRYNYIARLIDRASMQYDPAPLEGDVLVFRAGIQPENIRPDPTLGWGLIVRGKLSIIDVEGTHNSIFANEPHVAALVKKIEAHLDDIESMPPS